MDDYPPDYPKPGGPAEVTFLGGSHDGAVFGLQRTPSRLRLPVLRPVRFLMTEDLEKTSPDSILDTCDYERVGVNTRRQVVYRIVRSG